MRFIETSLEVNMQGFILEQLYPTGWRREGQLFWRFSDAVLESQRLLAAKEVRGVRVLSVRVLGDALTELRREPDPGLRHAPDIAAT